MEWEKDQEKPLLTEESTSKTVERNTLPTLRSSKNRQTIAEIQEDIEKNTIVSKEQISTDFLSVAAMVAATGIYTIAAQIINTHLF